MRAKVEFALKMRMMTRKTRLFCREAWHKQPGTVWFSAWTIAFLVYLGIGLTPAAATEYEIIGDIEIPEVGISSEVAKIQLTNGQIPTPDAIVGEFTRNNAKKLLVGHATGVFSNLSQVEVGDEIYYSDGRYEVESVNVYKKDDIQMNQLLAGEEDELVLMTCAGEIYINGDATERLIVEARKID